MNIDVATSDIVRDHQCISCMKCTSEAACPVSKTVNFSVVKPKKKISANKLGIISVGILFGGIAVSMLLGLWSVESSKQPALIKEGSFVGQPSPSDIRGSYTWGDVSKAFGISAPLLVEAFGATSSVDRVSLLEAQYVAVVPEGQEVGTDSVRLFVSLYTGLPHTPEEGTLLPSSAIVVLKRQAKDSSPLFEDVASRAVPSLHTETATGFTQITYTGKTTFKELIDSGYLIEDIEALVGKPRSLSMAIKDYATELGMEFSEMKEKLSFLTPTK